MALPSYGCTVTWLYRHMAVPSHGSTIIYTEADSLCELKENIFSIFFKYGEEKPNTTSNTLN